MQSKTGSIRVVLSVAVILVLLSAGIVGCSGENDDKKDEKAAAGSPPAEINPRNKSNVVLKRLDGSTARVSDYGGKYLFVTFFATWNIESREMIPIMKVLQSRFSRTVTFLAVSMDSKNPAVVKNFVTGNSIDFEVMVDGERTANSFGGARKLPTTYILLKDGMVITKIEGLQREKKYVDALRYIFNKRL